MVSNFQREICSTQSGKLVEFQGMFSTSLVQNFFLFFSASTFPIHEKNNYLQGRIFSSFNKIYQSLETINVFIFYCIKFYPQKNIYKNIYLPVLFV